MRHNEDDGNNLGLIPLALIGFCLFMFSMGFMEAGYKKLPDSYKQEVPLLRR